MNESQLGLFEQQMGILAGDEVEVDLDLIKSEHRSHYLQFVISGVTLAQTAQTLLERSRANFTHAARVASLHRDDEEYANADRALTRLASALKEVEKILN